MIGESTPSADIDLEVDPFGEGLNGWHTTLSAGEDYIELVWQESMDSHVERFEGSEDYHILFDEDGGIRPEAIREFVNIIQAELSGRGLSVDCYGLEEWSDEHGMLPIAVTTSIREDELWWDETCDKLWPAYAVLANKTDPGTFGHTYIMNDIIRKLKGEQA